MVVLPFPRRCAVNDPLLVGATGMVGSAIMALTADPLTVLARRQPDEGWPSGIKAIVAPVERWEAQLAEARPLCLLNALGTTIAAAGSQAAFRAVDHDLVIRLARAAHAAGTRQMISVSAAGADAASRNFYLRTKGEVEQALRAIGFDRLDILRPGLLRGERKGPRRTGEALAMIAAPLTDALMHGPLRRYRSVAADDVARAMLRLAREGGTGTHVHEHDAITALAD